MGTVEQQGHLTLHLHMLVWIVNSLSPQEIRNRIMDPTSDFQKKMIDYLESAHTAEYVDSELEIVREEINDRKLYLDTLSLQNYFQAYHLNSVNAC